jgi:hypothetical protein
MYVHNRSLTHSHMHPITCTNHAQTHIPLTHQATTRDVSSKTKGKYVVSMWYVHAHTRTQSLAPNHSHPITRTQSLALHIPHQQLNNDELNKTSSTTSTQGTSSLSKGKVSKLLRAHTRTRTRTHSLRTNALNHSFTTHTSHLTQQAQPKTTKEFQI